MSGRDRAFVGTVFPLCGHLDERNHYMSRALLNDSKPSPQWLVSGALLAVLVLVGAFLLSSRFWLPEAPAVVGSWSAQVTYERGPTQEERFEFRLTGGDLTGSATYQGIRRAIENGRLEGDRVQFHTRSRERVGIEQHEMRHDYVGVVGGDGIAFTVVTAGGGREYGPVHFEAVRIDD